MLGTRSYVLGIRMNLQFSEGCEVFRWMQPILIHTIDVLGICARSHFTRPPLPVTGRQWAGDRVLGCIRWAGCFRLSASSLFLFSFCEVPD